MKFIEVNKARKLKFGEPVLALDKRGEYWNAKLLKKEEHSGGVVFTFEKAEFYDERGDSPLTSTDITHVAIP